MNINKKLKKTAALIVLTAFTAGNLMPAKLFAAQEISSAQALSASRKKDFSELKFPPKLGKVQEIYQPQGFSSKPAVILIQDAHAIPEAQHHIHKSILFFEKQYGADLIALEGAASKLDPQLFRSFPDQGSFKNILKEYARKAEVSGGVLAALMDTTHAEYAGVEDWELYEAGISLYLASAQIEKELLEKFQAEQSRLSEEKRKKYSPDLLRADGALQEIEKDGKKFLEALELLSAIKRPGVSSPLSALLTEIESSRENDGRFKEEVLKAYEQFVKQAGRTPPGMINLHKQSFDLGQISAVQFAREIQKGARASRIQIPQSHELAAAVTNLRKLENLQGPEIIDAFDSYGAEVKNSLFQNQAQRDLDRRSHDLYLASKTAKLELTRKEWDEVKRSAKEGEFWEGLKVPLLFYENAEKRDQIFWEKIQSLWVKRKQTPRCTVLVAGGFHTQGMTERLKEKMIPYAVVVPAISSVPRQTNYRKQMQGDVSWKNYFKEQNEKVSLYEAFARGMRDRLLKVPSSRGILAKQWRDKIILDLAAQNRLADAGKYTRFLDELGASQADLGPALTRLKNFAKGLLDLEAKGQFSKANIFQLLQMTKAATPSLVNSPAILTSDEASARLVHGNPLLTLRAEGRVLDLVRADIERMEDFPDELDETALYVYKNFGIDRIKNFEILKKVQHPSDPDLTVFLVRPVNAAKMSQEGLLIIDSKRKILVAGAMGFLISRNGSSGFQVSYIRAYERQRGWMRRAVKLLLKSRAVDVWISSTASLREDDAERAYLNLQQDDELLVDSVQDQYLVMLRAEARTEKEKDKTSKVQAESAENLIKTIRENSSAAERLEAFSKLSGMWYQVPQDLREQTALYMLSDPEPRVRQLIISKIKYFRDLEKKLEAFIIHPVIYTGPGRDPRLSSGMDHNPQISRYLARTAALFILFTNADLPDVGDILSRELETWNAEEQEKKLTSLYNSLPVGAKSGMREAPLGIDQPLSVLENLRLYQIWRLRRYEDFPRGIDSPESQKAANMSFYIGEIIDRWFPQELLEDDDEEGALVNSEFHQIEVAAAKILHAPAVRAESREPEGSQDQFDALAAYYKTLMGSALREEEKSMLRSAFSGMTFQNYYENTPKLTAALIRAAAAGLSQAGAYEQILSQAGHSAVSSTGITSFVSSPSLDPHRLAEVERAGRRLREICEQTMEYAAALEDLFYEDSENHVEGLKASLRYFRLNPYDPTWGQARRLNLLQHFQKLRWYDLGKQISNQYVAMPTDSLQQAYFLMRFFVLNRHASFLIQKEDADKYIHTLKSRLEKISSGKQRIEDPSDRAEHTTAQLGLLTELVCLLIIKGEKSSLSEALEQIKEIRSLGAPVTNYALLGFYAARALLILQTAEAGFGFWKAFDLFGRTAGSELDYRKIAEDFVSEYIDRYLAGNALVDPEFQEEWRHYSMGSLAAAQGKWDEALSYFDLAEKSRAVDLLLLIYFERAYVFSRMRETQESLTATQSYLELLAAFDDEATTRDTHLSEAFHFFPEHYREQFLEIAQAILVEPQYWPAAPESGILKAAVRYLIRSKKMSADEIYQIVTKWINLRRDDPEKMLSETPQILKILSGLYSFEPASVRGQVFLWVAALEVKHSEAARMFMEFLKQESARSIADHSTLKAVSRLIAIEMSKGSQVNESEHQILINPMINYFQEVLIASDFDAAAVFQAIRDMEAFLREELDDPSGPANVGIYSLAVNALASMYTGFNVEVTLESQREASSKILTDAQNLLRRTMLAALEAEFKPGNKTYEGCVARTIKSHVLYFLHYRIDTLKSIHAPEELVMNAIAEYIRFYPSVLTERQNDKAPGLLLQLRPEAAQYFMRYADALIMSGDFEKANAVLMTYLPELEAAVNYFGQSGSNDPARAPFLHAMKASFEGTHYRSLFYFFDRQSFIREPLRRLVKFTSAISGNRDTPREKSQAADSASQTAAVASLSGQPEIFFQKAQEVLEIGENFQDREMSVLLGRLELFLTLADHYQEKKLVDEREAAAAGAKRVLETMKSVYGGQPENYAWIAVAAARITFVTEGPEKAIADLEREKQSAGNSAPSAYYNHVLAEFYLDQGNSEKAAESLAHYLRHQAEGVPEAQRTSDNEIVTEALFWSPEKKKAMGETYVRVLTTHPELETAYLDMILRAGYFLDFQNTGQLIAAYIQELAGSPSPLTVKPERIVTILGWLMGANYSTSVIYEIVEVLSLRKDLGSQQKKINELKQVLEKNIPLSDWDVILRKRLEAGKYEDVIQRGEALLRDRKNMNAPASGSIREHVQAAQEGKRLVTQIRDIYTKGDYVKAFQLYKENFSSAIKSASLEKIMQTAAKLVEADHLMRQGRWQDALDKAEEVPASDRDKTYTKAIPPFGVFKEKLQVVEVALGRRHFREAEKMLRSEIAAYRQKWGSNPDVGQGNHRAIHTGILEMAAAAEAASQKLQRVRNFSEVKNAALDLALKYPEDAEAAFRQLLDKSITAFNAAEGVSDPRRKQAAYFDAFQLARLVHEVAAVIPSPPAILSRANQVLSQAMGNYWIPQLKDDFWIAHAMAEAERQEEETHETKQTAAFQFPAHKISYAKDIRVSGLTHLNGDRGGKKIAVTLKGSFEIGDTFKIIPAGNSAQPGKKALKYLFKVSGIDEKTGTVSFEIPKSVKKPQEVIQEILDALTGGGTMTRISNNSWSNQRETLRSVIRNMESTLVNHINPEDSEAPVLAVATGNALLNRMLGLSLGEKTAQSQRDQWNEQLKPLVEAYEVKEKAEQEAQGKKFSFDPEQREALLAILNPNEPIVLIQGPPGTGKTTVLKAAIRLLIQIRQSVLVTSQQNHAIDKVLLKTMEGAAPQEPWMKRLVRTASGAEGITHQDILRIYEERIQRLQAIEREDQNQLGSAVAGTVVGLTQDREFRKLQKAIRKIKTGIMDESSRATRAESLHLLTYFDSLNRLISVGDPFQLPAYGVTREDVAAVAKWLGRGPLQDDEMGSRTFEDVFSPYRRRNFKISLFEKTLGLFLNESQGITKDVFETTTPPFFYFDVNRRFSGWLLIKHSNYFYKKRKPLRTETTGPGYFQLDDTQGLSPEADSNGRFPLGSAPSNQTARSISDEDETYQRYNLGEVDRSIYWLNHFINVRKKDPDKLAIITPFRRQVTEVKKAVLDIARLHAYLKARESGQKAVENRFLTDNVERYFRTRVYLQNLERFRNEKISMKDQGTIIDAEARRLWIDYQELVRDQNPSGSGKAKAFREKLGLGDRFVKVMPGGQVNLDVRLIAPKQQGGARAAANLEDTIDGMKTVTVDTAIGDEWEGVIVSWVRSNSQREVGFLAGEEGFQRRNVADSRGAEMVQIMDVTNFIENKAYGSTSRPSEVSEWAQHKLGIAREARGLIGDDSLQARHEAREEIIAAAGPRSESRPGPAVKTESGKMLSDMKRFLSAKVRNRGIDPKRYEYVDSVLPYRILAAKNSQGKILGFAFGKKENVYFHELLTEPGKEPDGFIFNPAKDGIRITTYIAEGDAKYKEDEFLLHRVNHQYLMTVSVTGGNPLGVVQSSILADWIPSYILTQPHEINPISKAIGDKLAMGFRQFIPPGAKVILPPGMGPEDKMTFWPSMDGTIQSREAVFGGLDHEGPDFSRVRFEDGHQEAFSSSNRVPLLVPENGIIQWVFEDNVQWTAIQLTDLVMEVGRKRYFESDDPRAMSFRIDENGDYIFPDGVHPTLVEEPGEPYRIAFVYTHLELEDWVKPGVRVTADEKRTLGTIQPHRKYLDSAVAPHLHFAVMLIKNSEITKHPHLNYQIINGVLGPERKIMYVNPLSLLTQQQRSELFVEGAEALPGFRSIALDAFEKTSGKKLRAKLAHAFMGIPVYANIPGTKIMSDAALKSQADVRISQTAEGWTLELKGEISQKLQLSQKTIPLKQGKEVQELLRQLEALDLTLRELSKTEKRPRRTKETGEQTKNLLREQVFNTVYRKSSEIPDLVKAAYRSLIPRELLEHLKYPVGKELPVYGEDDAGGEDEWAIYLKPLGHQHFRIDLARSRAEVAANEENPFDDKVFLADVGLRMREDGTIVIETPGRIGPFKEAASIDLKSKSPAEQAFVYWVDHYLVPFANRFESGSIEIIRTYISKEALTLSRFVETPSVGGSSNLWVRTEGLGARHESRKDSENEIQRIVKVRKENAEGALMYLSSLPAGPKVNIYVYRQSNNGVYGGAYLLAREIRHRIPGSLVRMLLADGKLPSVFRGSIQGIELVEGFNPSSNLALMNDSDFNFFVSGGARQFSPLPSQPNVITGGKFRSDYDLIWNPQTAGMPDIHMNFQRPNSTVQLATENRTRVLEKDRMSFEQLAHAKELWHEEFTQDRNDYWPMERLRALNNFAQKNGWKIGNAILSWMYFKDTSPVEDELVHLIAAIESGAFDRQSIWAPEGRQILIHASVAGYLEDAFLISIQRMGVSTMDAGGRIYQGKYPITVVIHHQIPYQRLQDLQVLSGTMAQSTDMQGQKRWVGFPAYVTGWASSVEAMSTGMPWVHDRFDAGYYLFDQAFAALARNVLELHQGSSSKPSVVEGMDADRLAEEFFMEKNRTVGSYENLIGWSEFSRWFSDSLFQMNMVDDFAIELAKQKGWIPLRAENRGQKMSADEAAVRPMLRVREGKFTSLVADMRELLELYPHSPARSQLESAIFKYASVAAKDAFTQSVIDLEHGERAMRDAREALARFYEQTVLAEMTLPAEVKVHARTFDPLDLSRIYLNPGWSKKTKDEKLAYHLSQNRYRVRINGQDFVFGKGTYLEFEYPDGTSDFLYDYHNLFYAFAALKAPSIKQKRYVLYDEHADSGEADPINYEAENPFEMAQLYHIENFHAGVLKDLLRKEDGWRWKWLSHPWREPDKEEAALYDEAGDFTVDESPETGGIAGVDLDMISRGVGSLLTHANIMKLYQQDRDKLIRQLPGFETRAFFISDEYYLKPAAGISIFADLYSAVAEAKLNAVAGVRYESRTEPDDYHETPLTADEEREVISQTNHWGIQLFENGEVRAAVPSEELERARVFFDQISPYRWRGDDKFKFRRQVHEYLNKIIAEQIKRSPVQAEYIAMLAHQLSNFLPGLQMADFKTESLPKILNFDVVWAYNYLKRRIDHASSLVRWAQSDPDRYPKSVLATEMTRLLIEINRLSTNWRFLRVLSGLNSITEPALHQKKAQSAASALEKTAGDGGAFAKLWLGIEPPKMTEVDISDTLRRALKAHPDLKVAAEIQLDLGEQSSLGTYEVYLMEALLNFLKNAAESLPAPSERMIQPGDVSIRAHWMDSKLLEIVIEDKGLGITPEHLAAIRTHRAFTTKAEGHGIGMTRSIELVEGALQGTFEIESEVGKGTTIRLRFPAALRSEGRSADTPMDTFITETDLSKRIELARQLGVDTRLSQANYVDPAYAGYAMEVKKQVNPENRPLTAVYGGAGAGWPIFALSTNAAEVYMVDVVKPLSLDKLEEGYRQWDQLNIRFGLNNSFDLPLMQYKAGFGSVINFAMNGIERSLLEGLKAAGVSKLREDGSRNIRFESLPDGSIKIQFVWTYPGSEERLYTLVYVYADVTNPSSYPEILQNRLKQGIDLYYQHAPLDIPEAYGKFLLRIAEAIRSGGFLVTDDISTNLTTYESKEFNPDKILEKSGENVWGERGQILTPSMASFGEAIKALRRRGIYQHSKKDAEINYGWKMEIRRRSETRESSELAIVDLLGEQGYRGPNVSAVVFTGRYSGTNESVLSDEHIQISPDSHILLVGNSPDEVERFLKKYPLAEITVVDISPSQLNRIKEKFEGSPDALRLKLFRADAAELDPQHFPDQIYDLIVLSALDESAYSDRSAGKKHLRKIAGEMTRVLAPGGVLFHSLEKIQDYYANLSVLHPAIAQKPGDRPENREDYMDPIYQQYPQLVDLKVNWFEFLRSSREDAAAFKKAHEGGEYVQSSFEWLEALKNDFSLTPDKKILDVGSGNGVAAIAFHIMTGAEVTSIEMDPERWKVLSHFLQFLKDKKGMAFPKVHFKQADFLEFPLEGYDFIYFYFTAPEKYGLPYGDKVAQYLDKHLPRNTVFVSPGFYLQDERKKGRFEEVDRSKHFQDAGLVYKGYELPEVSLYPGHSAVFTRRSENRIDPEVAAELRELLQSTPEYYEREGVGRVIDLSKLKIPATKEYLYTQILLQLKFIQLAAIDSITLSKTKPLIPSIRNENLYKTLIFVDGLGEIAGFILSRNYEKNWKGFAQMEWIISAEDAPLGTGTLLMDAWIAELQKNQVTYASWLYRDSSLGFFTPYLQKRNLPHLPMDATRFGLNGDAIKTFKLPEDVRAPAQRSEKRSFENSPSRQLARSVAGYLVFNEAQFVPAELSEQISNLPGAGGSIKEFTEMIEAAGVRMLADKNQALVQTAFDWMNAVLDSEGTLAAAFDVPVSEKSVLEAAMSRLQGKAALRWIAFVPQNLGEISSNGIMTQRVRDFDRYKPIYAIRNVQIQNADRVARIRLGNAGAPGSANPNLFYVSARGEMKNMDPVLQRVIELAAGMMIGGVTSREIKSTKDLQISPADIEQRVLAALLKGDYEDLIPQGKGLLQIHADGSISMEMPVFSSLLQQIQSRRELALSA